MIGREEEKKILVPNSVHTRPRQENSKKKKAKKFKKFQKTSFRYYFLPKWDEIGQEREKKNLGPNSVHIGPRQGNSERNSKKIKKPLSGIIPKQNWMR